MKRLFSIAILCGFLIPNAYGDGVIKEFVKHYSGVIKETFKHYSSDSSLNCPVRYTYPYHCYFLLVASYRELSAATEMETRLIDVGFEPIIQIITIEGQGDFYRLILSPFSTMTEMETARRRLATMGIDALRIKTNFLKSQFPGFNPYRQ